MKNINQYLSQITLLLLATRPNAINKNLHFYFKPKIIACVPEQFQPIIRLIKILNIKNLIYMYQTHLDNSSIEIFKKKKIMSLKKAHLKKIKNIMVHAINLENQATQQNTANLKEKNYILNKITIKSQIMILFFAILLIKHTLL